MSTLIPVKNLDHVQLVAWLQDQQEFIVQRWLDEQYEIGRVNTNGENYRMIADHVYGGIACNQALPLVAMTGQWDNYLLLYSAVDESMKKVKMKSTAGNMGGKGIAWSPDGEYLAVEGEELETGTKHLYIVSKEARVIRALKSNTEYGFYSVSWSRDNLLAYYQISGGITIVNLDGNVVRHVEGSSPSFNPQQDILAYVRWDQKMKIGKVILDLPNGKQKEIKFFDYLHIPHHLLWSPDGSKLLFDSSSTPSLLKRSSKAWCIYDLQSGKTTELAKD